MDMATARQECQSATALPDHLSWSALGTYSTCPRRYSFRYVEKARGERRSSSLLFGGAIHRAIEAVYEARMVGNEPPNGEGLLAAFDEAWKEAAQPGPTITFGKGETPASLREAALRMLSAFREHAAGSDATVIGIEHAIRFRLVPDAPPLEARLDLVEMAGRDLIVTDFKTARSAWNDAKTREHLPQLVAYSVASLPLMLELGATRIVPRFTVITKGKATKVQTIEPQASQDDVGRFKQSVSETWQAIKAGVFVRREGWHCKDCPFRDRCQGHPAGQAGQ
jgi:hypothetical protein